MQKMITSKQLAKIAGVSQSTVSRCLNGSKLVSEETRRRVEHFADQYSFSFNSAARGLRLHRSGCVGYVFSENFRGFPSNILQSILFFGVQQKLCAYHMDLIPIFDPRSGDESNIEQYVRDRRVDALIVNRTSLPQKLIELMQENRIPCIFIYDADENAPYPFVIANSHFQSGQLVGNAFAEKGLRRIIEVLGPRERVDVGQKHRGFAMALRQRGVELLPENAFYGRYDFNSGYQIASENIDAFKRAEACFAHNDSMALGVLKALLENHVRVPDDVALIGHDNIEMSNWSYPRLTTVAINYERMCSLSAAWVHELLEAESLPEESRRVIVNSSLVIRDTFS